MFHVKHSFASPGVFLLGVHLRQDGCEVVELEEIVAERVDQQRLERRLQQAQEAVRRGEDPVQVSLAFCRSVREAGGRILWDPQEMQESQEMRGTQETR